MGKHFPQCHTPSYWDDRVATPSFDLTIEALLHQARREHSLGGGTISSRPLALTFAMVGP